MQLFLKIGLFFLLLPTLAMGNVIFPVFAAPYFAQVYFPVIVAVVLALEACVVGWHWKSLGAGNSLMLVTWANVFSWIVGVVIVSLLLPGGWENQKVGGPVASELFVVYVWLSLPVTFLLSFTLEGYIYWRLREKYQLKDSFKVAFRANGISYLFITGVFFWFLAGEF